MRKQRAKGLPVLAVFVLVLKVQFEQAFIEQEEHAVPFGLGNIPPAKLQEAIERSVMVRLTLFSACLLPKVLLIFLMLMMVSMSVISCPIRDTECGGNMNVLLMGRVSSVTGMDNN